jgi:hypothetical protein
MEHTLEKHDIAILPQQQQEDFSLLEEQQVIDGMDK